MKRNTTQCLHRVCLCVHSPRRSFWNISVYIWLFRFTNKDKGYYICPCSDWSTESIRSVADSVLFWGILWFNISFYYKAHPALYFLVHACSCNSPAHWKLHRLSYGHKYDTFIGHKMSLRQKQKCAVKCFEMSLVSFYALLNFHCCSKIFLFTITTNKLRSCLCLSAGALGYHRNVNRLSLIAVMKRTNTTAHKHFLVQL